MRGSLLWYKNNTVVYLLIILQFEVKPPPEDQRRLSGMLDVAACRPKYIAFAGSTADCRTPTVPYCVVLLMPVAMNKLQILAV